MPNKAKELVEVDMIVRMVVETDSGMDDETVLNGIGILSVHTNSRCKIVKSRVADIDVIGRKRKTRGGK